MASVFNNLLCAAVLAASLMAVSGFQFRVGGVKGWRTPTGDEPETYNEWAAKNRFHIGDTLYFKYEKDSVLVVSSADYLNCNTSNPLSKFEDGKSVFQFDRSGPFYFISGQPGHCKLGQRLIIRVLHPVKVEAPVLAPSLAPAPAPGGESGGDSGQWRAPAKSSTGKLYVVSYFMTAVVGFFVIVYLFV
ncbi:hypothetical protein CASFOL_041459 [Castilleja foliolosa]|uniref:Phytocyanin domain-containing protein n=1 Tax=Castilleja foliolosa TaxID=1961234 RepID=A0ABD3BCX0_9LAMI